MAASCNVMSCHWQEHNSCSEKKKSLENAESSSHVKFHIKKRLSSSMMPPENTHLQVQGGSITVWLTSIFTGLDSVALFTSKLTKYLLALLNLYL